MKEVGHKIKSIPKQVIRFRMPLFFAVLAVVYGFIIWRISVLSQAPASIDTGSQASSAAAPHIDQATVNKIEQLQDNSVSVKALFDQARQNPFNE